MISVPVELAVIIFEFLLINSVYALILSGIVVSLKILLPSLPANLEYGLWIVVLVRLVLPPQFGFDIGLSGMSCDWVFNSNILPTNLAFCGTYYTPEQTSRLYQNLAEYNQPINFLISAWLLIMGGLLVRYTILQYRLFNLLSDASPEIGDKLTLQINKWKLIYQIEQPILLVSDERFSSAFTYYTDQPIVFVPKDILDSENDVMIESIIAHEMAHIKRKDALGLTLLGLIRLVYLFNPLVWLILARMTYLREISCDLMAIKKGDLNAERYGESLIGAIRFTRTKNVFKHPLTAFLGSKAQLKRRILNIRDGIDYSMSAPATRIWMLGFAVFFLPFNAGIEYKNPLSIEEIRDIKKERELEQQRERELEINSPFPSDIRKDVNLPVVSKADRKAQKDKRDKRKKP